MGLSLWVNDTQLVPSAITIRVNPEDERRARDLVVRSAVVLKVEDQGSFNYAKNIAGELTSMVKEIDADRKAVKAPWRAVENAIDQRAKQVGEPVTTELNRVLGLLNGYVAQLEVQKEADRLQREAKFRAQMAEETRKLKEAQEAQARAEQLAREATDEAARLRAREEATTRMLVAAQAELAQEMAKEAAEIGAKAARSLVPGGRVDHPYEFKLVDVRLCVREGGWRLLRWEVDKLACQDSCRAQRDIEPNKMPRLPGIEVTQTVSVSVKASARIE